ncbi:Uncharacterized membrane protein YdjX, TVP38/TMEM64 family, SNARE-associated domain [Amycolatopsis arida]|uniref:TVP38/TMEM64 family membrane protein n=1 Tax=Amycolatopsis arida TaxID=587909 RepID=A0A1I5ZW24_9PSEU|nr:putative membrane protein YdjX (TVP38/TMEM64 family) [Amycolatopsis arida]SFQ60457.1 Uncharacterized membrane protein YdjX, TVP38/TMEM64 family, SNARE-associated domain [Amycolatopsis arida]
MPRRTQLLAAGAALTALVAAALLLPVPGPAALRAWADGAGPVAPLLLLAGYAVLTVAPIPRTVFSLAAGLLLGNALGIAVAMTATAISAALGFLLARALGRDLVAKYLRRPAVRTVDERLAGGGALAVASLRLIPVIPFAPLSYCCGLSSVRPRPYLAGTVVGSLPGTAAVVLLGDALTGGTPPALLICYAAFALAGAAGLYRAVRPVGSRPARGNPCHHKDRRHGDPRRRLTATAALRPLHSAAGAPGTRATNPNSCGQLGEEQPSSTPVT